MKHEKTQLMIIIGRHGAKENDKKNLALESLRSWTVSVQKHL